MTIKNRWRAAGLLAAIHLVSVPSGWADDATQDPWQDYLTIREVRVSEVEDLGPGLMGNLDFLGARALQADPSVVDGQNVDPVTAVVLVEKIVNIGLKVWKVVEANRPVVGVSRHVAHAVPEGVNSWRELEGWDRPRTRVYRVEYENFFGMTVVSFTYRVLYTAGGHVGGTGNYLANVTIVPADLQVAWGYTFNAEVDVPQVVNVGSRNRPLAGAELLLSWRVATVMKESHQSMSYFVQGDGRFYDLNRRRERESVERRLRETGQRLIGLQPAN